MVALGMILMAGGGIASFVGSIQILIAAFKESTGQGLLSFFLAPYMLYYIFTRWEACKKAFLMSIGGSVAIVLGSIVAAMGAA